MISLAEAAASRAQWLEALDLASQALTMDPSRTAAAAVVGSARARLGTLTAPSAELRQVTVVAVDMHGSTSIAAGIGPERTRELMLEVYGVCVEAVARFEGRVIKYLGDGVLAQFGYPVTREEDARRAVFASLAIIDGVKSHQADWQARFGEEIAVRIGVDSGLAAVGPMDASPFSGDEIAGDPPNIASRVQAAAERMTVSVTDATAALIRGWFETLPTGPVELRNYPRPIGLHRVLGPTGAETRLDARGGVRPPLTGRDGELATMRAAWNRMVTTGERQIITLTGEAGIGKSRLLEHLVATSVAAGATHLTFSCSRLHRESSLRPVARALGRFFRVPPPERRSAAMHLDEIREQLEQLENRRIPSQDSVPIYGRVLGIGSAIELEPEILRRHTFEAVIDLLEAIAETTMLVLCVDDADTADPSTVQLLNELLARPPQPMLVALTGRELPPELSALGQVLELDGLGDSDAVELVRAISPELPDSAVERIVGGSDGVPYLLEEQARAAEEVSAPEGAPLELSVFLAARLDELGAGLKQLLGEIAIAGAGVPVQVLRQLTEAEPATLDDRLDELAERKVLVRVSEAGGDIVRFRHGLMREAAYDGILATERKRMHLRLADYLADSAAGAAPEDIARHYSVGGDGPKAARWWAEAARGAAAAGANAEAIELFGRGLAALEGLSESEITAGLELELQLGLGATRSSTDGYTAPEARASFERAVLLGEQLADTTTLFPALWGTWSYWFVLGEHQLAAGLADRCLRIAEEADDIRLRYEAAAIVGYQRLYLGDFEAASSELELAGEHVGVEPVAAFPHDPGIVSRSAHAVALWFLGDAAASKAAAETALSLVAGSGPPSRRGALTEAWVCCTLAWRAELAGEHAAAIELADRAAATAGRHGYATWLAAATLHRSIGQCSLGDLDQGLPVLTAMVDAWRTAGRDETGRQRHPVLMTPYFAGRLAEFQLATGSAEAAAESIELLLAATNAGGEQFWDAELKRLRDSVPS